MQFSHQREAFKKKENKKCGFFPHWGGSTPNPHFFISVDFQGGGWGVFGPIYTLFCPILFFLKEFCPILSSFCWLEGHFQGEIEEKIFSPKMCFHTLGGGRGGSGRCGKNPHFLFFFFLKASLISHILKFWDHICLTDLK